MLLQRRSRSGDPFAGCVDVLAGGHIGAGESTSYSGNSTALELRYAHRTAKLRELHTWLPQLKQQIREFFGLSKSVKAVFLQLDDFYHLARVDQPDVMDYLHRLCKDLPLYFKVATLRHSSTLYADRDGQPIGAQERHDYQPINIDFAFTDFRRTANQNRQMICRRVTFTPKSTRPPSDTSGCSSCGRHGT